MGPNPVIPCAYKKGKFGYSLRQKEGHLASPGKTEATRNPGEAWNGFSSQPLGRTHPVTSFFADSQARKLWDCTFLLFQATQFLVLRYGSPRKWVQFWSPKRHRTVSENLSVLGFSFPICKVAVWEWMMSGPLCSDTWWLILQKVHSISSKVTDVVFPNVALDMQQIHFFFFFSSHFSSVHSGVIDDTSLKLDIGQGCPSKLTH